ncbi:MAG: uL30 family ribosomal protein [Candidatus Bilamarchaeaceae archaeon]
MVTAIIRIRGVRSIAPDIKKTFELLKLEKPNYCAVVHENPMTKGMLNRIHNFAAYGDVSEAALAKLLAKRGSKAGVALKPDEAKKIAKEVVGGKKLKELADPVFRLHAPRKGFKSTKSHYPRGDLGRRPSMDELITKMM